MTAEAGEQNERHSALAAHDLTDVPPDDPVVADLTALCQLAAMVIGAPTAAVVAIDARGQHQLAMYGTDPTAFDRDDALCQTLRTPSGRAVGTLCVFDEQPREISGHQRDALHLLARQVVAILELRLRSRQLERSHAELSRSQERMASFVRQINHDLKAPITAILGFAELLDDLALVAENPTATAYVGRCRSAARRMLAMIDDL